MTWWYKVHGLAHSDRKFEMIADLVGPDVDPPTVATTFFQACDHANEHGGSLERFDLRVVARYCRRSIEVIRRIWQWLIDEGMVLVDGMIDGIKVIAGQLRAWAQRQGSAYRPAAGVQGRAGAANPGRPRQRRRIVIDAEVDDSDRVTEAVTGDDPSPCTPYPDQNRAPPCSPPPSREGDAAPLVEIDPNPGGAAPAGQPAGDIAPAIAAWSPRITPLMAGTSLHALATGSETSFPLMISGGADAYPPRRRRREPTARETLSAVCAEWADALRGTDFWRVDRGAGSGMAAAGG